MLNLNSSLFSTNLGTRIINPKIIVLRIMILYPNGQIRTTGQGALILLYVMNWEGFLLATDGPGSHEDDVISYNNVYPLK